MGPTRGLAVACVLAAVLTACGGGGGGSTIDSGNGTPVVPPTPTPMATYGGVAYTLGEGCSFAVGTITTGESSASTAEAAARQRCNTEARRLAAGRAFSACDSYSFEQCASIAVGEDSAGCNLRGHVRSSIRAASSAAIQNCRNQLGSDADCQVLAESCASGSPDSGVWTSSVGRGPDTDPPIQRFGAIITSPNRLRGDFHYCESGYVYGVGFGSSVETARDAAKKACLDEGGKDCSLPRGIGDIRWQVFGGYLGSKCGALAYVEYKSPNLEGLCYFNKAGGDTKSSAELNTTANHLNCNPSSGECSIIGSWCGQ